MVLVDSERVERLEHEMRIAARKGDADKLASVKRKLEMEVRTPRANKSSSVFSGGVGGGGGAAGAAVAAPAGPFSPRGPLQGAVSVVLPVHTTVRVRVWLHVRRLVTSAEPYVGEATHAGLRVFEKNKGDHVVKAVPFGCYFISDRSALRSTTLPGSDGKKAKAFPRIRAMSSFASSVVNNIGQSVGSRLGRAGSLLHHTSSERSLLAAAGLAVPAPPAPTSGLAPSVLEPSSL